MGYGGIRCGGTGSQTPFPTERISMVMFIAGPGSPFPTGDQPVSNATADLNGDGHLDLLFANYATDNISVLLGDGNGGFTAAAPVAAGNGPRAVEVGDLDGDGDIDFLSTDLSGYSVTVGLNNGTGTRDRPSPSNPTERHRGGRSRW